MEKKRFAVKQTVAVLKEAEAGMPVGRAGTPHLRYGANVSSLKKIVR